MEEICSLTSADEQKGGHHPMKRGFRSWSGGLQHLPRARRFLPSKTIFRRAEGRSRKVLRSPKDLSGRGQAGASLILKILRGYVVGRERDPGLNEFQKDHE